jgi:hypothetical protein
MEIKLTNSNKVAIVDDEDWFLLALWKYKWREKWSYSKDFVYIVTSVWTGANSKSVYLHRLITGVNGSKNEIHHDDDDPFNNRRTNLVVMTKGEHIQEHIKNAEKYEKLRKQRNMRNNIIENKIPF